MVKMGIFERHEDVKDRRNIVIKFTPRAAKSTGLIDDRLNKYILNFFSNCPEEELTGLEAASRLVCRVLDAAYEEEQE